MSLVYEDVVESMNQCHGELDKVFEQIKEVITELMPVNTDQESSEEASEEATKKNKALIDKTVKAAQAHLDEIKKFYKISMRKAQKATTEDTIIKSYNEYIDQLRKTRENIYSAKGGETAYKIFDASKESLGHIYDARRICAIFYNFKKMCEIVFWASSAITLYASVFLVALPMLIVQPSLGLAVTIAIGGLLLKTAKNCIDCFSEFKSFTRYGAEYDAKVALLSFFAPNEPSQGNAGLIKDQAQDTTNLILITQ